MRLGRESQISSIIRASVLFLFGLTSVSSSGDRLTCATPCIVSAVPFLVCSANDQVCDSYLRRMWLARQVGRGAVEMRLGCDNDGRPVVAPRARRDAGREGAAGGSEESPLRVMGHGRFPCFLGVSVSGHERDESYPHDVVSLATGCDWRWGTRKSTSEPRSGFRVANSLV